MLRSVGRCVFVVCRYKERQLRRNVSEFVYYFNDCPENMLSMDLHLCSDPAAHVHVQVWCLCSATRSDGVKMVTCNGVD